MSELQHAIRMLSYRMRRYPLWIVVVITVVPLFITTRWVLLAFPWTSAVESSLPHFIRIDDHRWIKHTNYSISRSKRWGVGEASDYSDDVLIDVNQQLMSRLRTTIPLESHSEPTALKNGSLLFWTVKKDKSRSLIVNLNTSTVKSFEKPAARAFVVDGQFLVFLQDDELSCFDLLTQTPGKPIRLWFPQNLSEVTGSPHVMTWGSINSLLDDDIASPRIRSILLNTLLHLLGQYGLLLDYFVWMDAGFISLYSVSTEGLQWKTSWITGNTNRCTLTMHGLIQRIPLHNDRIEIIRASEGKVIASHPRQMRNQQGTISHPAWMWFGGIVYSFPGEGSMLMDATQPGRVLQLHNPDRSPTFDYDPNFEFFWTANHYDTATKGVRKETIDIRSVKTGDIISTWLNNMGDYSGQILGFSEDSRFLVATDNQHRVLKIDVNTGNVVATIEPFRKWLAPLALLCLCNILWYVAYSVSCEQLRIPIMLRAAFPFALLLALALSRLYAIGHPEFTQRVSYQSLLAIVFVFAIHVATHFSPSSTSKASMILVLTFLINATRILIHKYQKDWFESVESMCGLVIVCCVAATLFLIYHSLRKLRQAFQQSTYLRFSLRSALFWLTLALIVLASTKHFFRGTPLFDYDNGLDFTRLFIQPMLGTSLLFIVTRPKTGLVITVLQCIAWISLITVIHTLIFSRSLNSNNFLVHLQEQFFYSCSCTIPISVLSFFFFLPTNHWVKRLSKASIGVRN